MSKETLEHLNTNTLIGNTKERGTAWHYRAEHQGTLSNHYEGPIPVEDVQSRLFDWSAESRRVAVEVPADPESMTHLNGEGHAAKWVSLEGRQAIARSDNDHVMGIFTAGYERHQYNEWLLTSVANILDDSLSISSAGLLRGGAIAWVEVSMPAAIMTPEGVEFRPNLLATTSFDGSIATTFKRTITATICDNTREMALGERGQQVKVKHSRNSALKLAEARSALEIVHRTGDEFAAEVAKLCRIDVDERAWAQFLDIHAPLTDPVTRERLEGRSLSIVTSKRDALQNLYRSDERVEPWIGTAYGVLQAVNTWEHHNSVVRGATRPERNMLRTVSGDFSRVDQAAWKELSSVLATR